jgi:hypothetical protein
MSTWRILKNMTLLQTNKFFHLQGILLQGSKTPHTSRLITCKKPRVHGKPNKRRKRLNDESIGLAKALFEFAKSFTKIDIMKIAKINCFGNYGKSTCYGLDVCKKYV